MKQHDKVKPVIRSLLPILGRNSFILAIVLGLLFPACAPFTTTEPPVQIQPTYTEVSSVTPTTTPTLVPSPTIEVTSSPVATPTEDPNQLTYKDATGQEVTVELGIHKHTNKKGEVITLTEIPADWRAFLTYFAEHAKWYPASIEVLPPLQDIAGLDPQTHKEITDFWAQFDIPYPPKDRHSWGSSYPQVTGPSGGTFMAIFITGLDGGTLAISRQQDGTLIGAFINEDTQQLSEESRFTPEGEQYLNILASQHK